MRRLGQALDQHGRLDLLLEDLTGPGVAFQIEPDMVGTEPRFRQLVQQIRLARLPGAAQ